MTSIWDQHWMFIVLFLAFGLFTVIVNSLTIRRMDQYPQAEHYPRVSVLVPARNEERNIEQCISSLLAQDYPDFDVIVLDDHSTDKTHQILGWLATADDRLKVLTGKPLPAGWLGKHWACQQLGENATGELILFTDADTCHARDMLRHGVSAMLAEKADLVTAFPQEKAVTWGEKLLVPFIAFGIFTFLPVKLIQRMRWSALSITIGQFMLFRRDAYRAIGEYKTIRHEVVDDVSLGQRIIDLGFEWRLLDGTRQVSCRMYRGFWESVDGFSKNLFAIFNFRILPFLLAFILVGMVFIEPVLALVAYYFGWSQPAIPLLYAQTAIITSLSLWILVFRRFQFPQYLVVFYPLIIFLFVMVALRSFVQNLSGSSTWKERTIDRTEMHWL